MLFENSVQAFVSPLICKTEALQIKGIADRKTAALLATGLGGHTVYEMTTGSA